MFLLIAADQQITEKQMMVSQPSHRELDRCKQQNQGVPNTNGNIPPQSRKLQAVSVFNEDIKSESDGLTIPQRRWPVHVASW